MSMLKVKKANQNSLNKRKQKQIKLYSENVGSSSLYMSNKHQLARYLVDLKITFRALQIPGLD